MLSFFLLSTSLPPSLPPGFSLVLERLIKDIFFPPSVSIPSLLSPTIWPYFFARTRLPSARTMIQPRVLRREQLFFSDFLKNIRTSLGFWRFSPAFVYELPIGSNVLANFIGIYLNVRRFGLDFGLVNS